MHENRMKHKLIIVVAIIVLGFSASNFSDDKGRQDNEKMIIQKFNYESVNSIGKYGFPLTVNSFVKDLGPPDSTFTDDNESCPVGQIHTWCLRSQNLKIMVLGDHYNPKVDYSAECRLFAVAKCDSSKDTEFKGLWGIKLGDSDKAVKERLLQLVGKNRNIILSKDNKRAPIHVFLKGFSISHHHTIKKDNLYLYFVINKNGKLEVILQSSMDLSTAC